MAKELLREAQAFVGKSRCSVGHSVSEVQDRAKARSCIYCEQQFALYEALGREAGAPMTNEVSIPDWKACEALVAGNAANALEQFVYWYDTGDLWRERLRSVLLQARGDWESEPCRCARCVGSAAEPSAAHIHIFNDLDPNQSAWACTGCNSKPCVCDQLSNTEC